jgi:integrase/recombinase XerD
MSNMDRVITIFNAEKVVSLDGDELVISIKVNGDGKSKTSKEYTVSYANAQLFDRYLSELKALNYSSDTITMYRSIVRMFLLHLGSKHFVNVNKEDLKAYFTETLRSRDITDNTIRHHYSGLDSFYKYLVDELDLLPINPVLSIKKYMRTFKSTGPRPERQVITVEDASLLVNSAFSSRDRAILLLGFKTGLRRKEICSLNVSGVNLEKRFIKIPPTPKRSYNFCFVDDELLGVLNRWISRRESIIKRTGKRTNALFITTQGNRLTPDMLGRMVKNIAIEAGICSRDPDADLCEKFTPHCMRYFFTTTLRKNGMAKEFRQMLRGDKLKDAEDIYDRITMEELKHEYFRCVPQLGVF